MVDSAKIPSEGEARPVAAPVVASPEGLPRSPYPLPIGAAVRDPGAAGLTADPLGAAAEVRRLPAWPGLRVSSRPGVVRRRIGQVDAGSVGHDARPPGATPPPNLLAAAVFAADVQDAIVLHLRGEWAGGAGNAPTGGHWVKGMQATWGLGNPEHQVNGMAVMPPGCITAQGQPTALGAEVLQRGVYFTGPTPTDQIKESEYTFRLVSRNQQGVTISPEKSSSFWPAGWTETQLRAVFASSRRTSTAGTYLSKANMTYYYQWQTLGSPVNTAFPVQRVKMVVNSDNTRSKENR